MKRLLFPLLAGVLLYSTPARAYIDPGSGSAIVGAIIGFIVAIALAIKTYWYKLKSLFGWKKPAAAEKSSTKEKD